MFETIRKMRIILPPSFKWGAVFLIVLMAAGAALELTAMGLVMPVAAVFADPGLLETNRWLSFVYTFFKFQNPVQFVIFSASILIIFFLTKNVYCYVLNCLQTKYAERLGINIARRLYGNYIHADYSFHLQNTSAELIEKIRQIPDFSYQILCPLLLIFSELFVFCFILLLVFSLMPWIALVLFGFIAVSGMIFQFALKKRLNVLSERRFQASAGITGVLTQSFMAVKDVKLSCTESFFEDRLAGASERQNHTHKKMLDMGQIPRFALEFSVVFTACSILIVFLCIGYSFTNILLYVSLFIVAAFRLIPSVSRIQYNLILIRGSGAFFERMFQDLTMPVPEETDNNSNHAGLTFKKEIRIRDVTFRYKPELPPVFRDFNAEIRCCECIALVGKTGAGKSTLADLVMGFLKPEKGTVSVDGVDIRSNLHDWRKKIGCVPQSIFLFSDSIRENIAFGIDPEKIDEEKLINAMKAAQIYDFVQSLPEKDKTKVGDFGIRLSGGQRQRIAIARALYREPELLILDEATSALDNETEKAVIDALQFLKGKLTIIMIAHRLSTLHYCDRTITVEVPDDESKQ